MIASVKAIEKLLEQTRVGFENAMQLDEIKSDIEEIGYTNQRLVSLTNMNGLLQNKYQGYRRVMGEQLIATSNLDLEVSKEKRHLSDLRIAAKRAIRGKKYKKFARKLGLDSPMKTSLEGILQQARQLYTNGKDDPAIAPLVSKFGMTNESLQVRLDALDNIDNLNKEQERIKGLSQIARVDRDDVHDTLKNEWSDFKELTTRKLGKTSQYLEILGIKAPSKVPVRKKTEEPPAEEPPAEEPPAEEPPAEEPQDTQG